MHLGCGCHGSDLFAVNAMRRDLLTTSLNYYAASNHPADVVSFRSFRMRHTVRNAPSQYPHTVIQYGNACWMNCSTRINKQKNWKRERERDRESNELGMQCKRGRDSPATAAAAAWILRVPTSGRDIARIAHRNSAGNSPGIHTKQTLTLWILLLLIVWHLRHMVCYPNVYTNAAGYAGATR